ncbi:MAG: RNase adaptor protein RapZ, partial [Lachnospiraceae bacterium]|nr:RNase adaptor protein RapZ [Lachnospiraceae bacterium]
MRLILVTGMSGSGKTTALKMLEDAGFYCVDNIPLPLVEKFIELVAMPENEIDKMVLGLDVRADLHFEEAHEVLKNLKEKGYPMEILFLDSDD